MNRLPWNDDFLKNSVLQAFSGLEFWYIFGWIYHLRIGVRIYTSSALAMIYRKSSETDKADFIAFAQCIFDSVEYGIYRDTCLLLGDICIFGNVRYEIFFSHLFTPSHLLLLKAIR